MNKIIAFAIIVLSWTAFFLFGFSFGYSQGYVDSYKSSCEIINLEIELVNSYRDLLIDYDFQWSELSELKEIDCNLDG